MYSTQGPILEIPKLHQYYDATLSYAMPNHDQQSKFSWPRIVIQTISQRCCGNDFHRSMPDSSVVENTDQDIHQPTYYYTNTEKRQLTVPIFALFCFQLLMSKKFFADFVFRFRKEWLSTTGSPKSRITKCEFTNERTISKLEFADFKIVR